MIFGITVFLACEVIQSFFSSEVFGHEYLELDYATDITEVSFLIFCTKYNVKQMVKYFRDELIG